MVRKPDNRTWAGEVVYAPYSIAVWIMTLSWMAGLVTSCIPLTWWRPFERFQTRWPQPQIAWALRFGFNRLKVEYDEGYDPNAVTVFVQNHVSVLDAHVATGSIKQPFCGLENASHAKIPGYGWMMRMGNAIWVHPKRPNKYVEIAGAFRERAARGISVLTFPEGHRTLDGKLRPFRRGVFAIARETGMPVSVVAVRGMWRVLPKGTFVLRPRTIEVYVGPQIQVAGLDDAELEDAIGAVRDVMEAWIERGEKRPELLGPYLASRAHHPTGSREAVPPPQG